MKTRFFLIPILMLFLAGCSLLTTATDVPGAQETFEPTSSPAIPESTPLPPEQTATPGPIKLLVWLPPQLDPNANSRAGLILKQRLEEFSQQYPDVIVEARIKAEVGPGGLVDSLTTASAAAPLTLPNLVALPYESMQAAALKGLLFPYDGLTNIMAETDWYDYAQELALSQDSMFGIPFAGDAQIMVYRPIMVEVPPVTWESALITSGPYAFPAADPSAVFTLAQYFANGGEVEYQEDRPTINENTLREVLEFLQQAEEVDLFPSWLTPFQTDSQVWESFQDNRTDMIVTWTSRYLAEETAESDFTQIITPDGRNTTLTTGWVWSLISANPEHHELSTRLAEFLSESSFMAEWTEALGYLAPRPSAMTQWSSLSLKTRLNRFSDSAQTLPKIDIMAILGPTLERATVDVLTRQSDPQEAARSAVESLAEP